MLSSRWFFPARITALYSTDSYYLFFRWYPQVRYRYAWMIGLYPQIRLLYGIKSNAAICHVMWMTGRRCDILLMLVVMLLLWQIDIQTYRLRVEPVAAVTYGIFISLSLLSSGLSSQATSCVIKTREKEIMVMASTYSDYYVIYFGTVRLKYWFFFEDIVPLLSGITMHVLWYKSLMQRMK